MVFSSPVFLFLFLPLTLALYFSVPPRARNTILLVMSFLFYAYGEEWFVLLMLLSILLNWGSALLISRHPGDPHTRKWMLAGAVVANLLLLGFFKYAAFFATEVNPLLTAAGIPALPVPNIHLAAGISFFTFQAMSYVIDIYRGAYPAERDVSRVALYISLFPQLIAGPIVRYTTIAAAIVERRVTGASFLHGLRRFIIGLAKKVLIANTLALSVDRVYALPAGELTVSLAWFGAFCFFLQIYFDFSGYSDMAIGLGRMLGFRFLENFNYPYAARSVREFWRRWHISLSTWFRDYLYFPLGGNRVSAPRTIFNLLVVFLLVGLWHGAAWTFILFGALQGVLMIAERFGLAAFLERAGAPAGHLYLWIAVLFSFALFRSADIEQAFIFWSALCGAGAASGPAVATVMTPYVLPALVVGILFSLPVYPWMRRRLSRFRSRLCGRSRALFDGTVAIALSLACLAFFGASVLHNSMTAYNPFIYFRF